LIVRTGAFSISNGRTQLRFPADPDISLDPSKNDKSHLSPRKKAVETTKTRVNISPYRHRRAHQFGMIKSASQYLTRLPLASWIPSNPDTITPYASEDFPHVFDDPSCAAVVPSRPKEPFGKATMFHQQAHRPNAQPPGYSRHYYDVHMLADSAVKN
jgi:hypothetical protein